MCKEKVSDLEEHYALICRKAIRCTTLKGEIEDFDAFAMVAHNRYNHHKRSKFNNPKNANSVNKSKCTHCNKTGHTKNKCFKLVGHREWWDYSRKNNSRNSPTIAIVETKGKDGAFDKALALLATTNKSGKVLNISTPISNSAWIIDSGAIDHMILDKFYHLNNLYNNLCLPPMLHRP